MNDPKQKLRWWQFSLRKFILLTTLFTVLAVAGWRYREWGRELCEERLNRWGWATINKGRITYSKDGFREFDSKFWLPMRVYEWTIWRNESDWHYPPI